MRCRDCQELLSEYIDGSLELGGQTKVEAHLSNCEPCRAVRDDLLQIVHFSHQLPLQAPSKSLWSRIQEDIQEQSPSAWRSFLRGWWARARTGTLRLTVPQLAAATAALIIVVSAGALLSNRDSAHSVEIAGAPQPEAEVVRLSNADFKHIEDQISKLSQSVERRKNGWDASLRDSFEKNLYYIDQSLVECRHQLKDNPADDVAQELMLNAYREKVRLLEGFEKF